MADLNTANYTTVFDNNFASGQSLNTGLFPLVWGNSSDFSQSNGALTLTSSASEGWSSVGFLQSDSGASSGQGYGLYSVTASLNGGEGRGVDIVLWPSDNNWPGPELDLLESLDSSRQVGYATIHYNGGGSNQYDSHTFNIDLTQKHTYAMDWEPGQITYYIDGTQVFSTTSNVPKDAADGGVNEAFGAQVSGANVAPTSSSVSVHLYDMSYATSNGGTTPAPTPVATPTPTPVAAATLTPTTDTTTTAAITPATTSTGTTPQFATTGDSSVTNSQTLFTAPGTDVLLSGQGSDVLFVNAASSDGWATIQNFHSGDVAAILGFTPGVSTIAWSQGTDPAGNTGATAAVSLKGDGTVNASITLAGISVSQAQAYQGSAATMNGVPFITVQG